MCPMDIRYAPLQKTKPALLAVVQCRTCAEWYGHGADYTIIVIHVQPRTLGQAAGENTGITEGACHPEGLAEFHAGAQFHTAVVDFRMGRLVLLPTGVLTTLGSETQARLSHFCDAALEALTCWEVLDFVPPIRCGGHANRCRSAM